MDYDYDYEKDFTYEPYDPDKEEHTIRDLMEKKTSVWCRNGKYVDVATHCEEVVCPFKNNKRRLASPKELKECHSFQITSASYRWKSAMLLYP
jgi:hypothetical protein